MKTYLLIFIAASLQVLLTTTPVFSQNFSVNLNHEPGHIDSTFGTGGTSRISVSGGYGVMSAGGQRGLMQVVSMAVEPDGKIVEGGYCRPQSSLDAFAVARFDSDGTPDNTFGTNGSTWTHLDSAGEDQAFSIAVQPDGKIVEAGVSENRTTGGYEFGIVRFNTAGTLDNSFGTNGYVKTFIPGGDNNWDGAFSVAVEKDGKIVVSGTSESDSNTVVNYNFAMTRLNSDGSIDNTFGTNGFIRALDLFLPSSNKIMNTVIQPDGKYLISISNSYLIRVNENGTFDNTFKINGVINTSALFGSNGWYLYLHSIALQPDGKIIDVGQNGHIFVTRFNHDGTLDSTFGTGGYTMFNDNSMESNWDAYSAVLQPDGKIIAAGTSELNGGGSRFQFAAVRFDSSGAIDSSFGAYGCARTLINGGNDSNDIATSVAIQPGGKIILGGTSQDVYNTNVGILSNSFAAARFYGGNSSVVTISLDKKTILFDSVEVGKIKDTTFVISNSGYDTLKINKIKSTNNLFVSKADSLYILPGQSFTDTLKFKPVSQGNFSGQLIVVSNAINSPDTVKLSGTGELATGIREHINGAPKTYFLSQNYPNPFNPSTIIKYQIPKASLVMLKIYDILGREVASLVNERQDAGNYKVDFNAEKLSSGIYFYKMTAGSFTKVKKLLLLK